MSELLPYEPIICPHCGAPSWEETYRCWLCRRETHAAPRVVATTRIARLDASTVAIPAKPAKSAPEFAPALRRAFSFSLMTLMSYITAIAVGFGLTWIYPGFGILYGLLIFLPLVLTSIASMIRRARGKVETRWRRVANFAMNVGIATGLLFSLAIAAFAAFFVICVFDPPTFVGH
jgi:hypothetical protein